MEESEESIFSNIPDWKRLFLLEMKIKKNLGCPNNEYVIVKHFYQNIRANPRSKKISVSITDWENIQMRQRLRAKRGLGKQSLVCFKHS